MLNIIIDAAAAGAFNMQKDLELFAARENNNEPSPTLRIYQWQPQCISLGYGQNENALLNVEACRKAGWDIVKRITGGGIVFHNTDEITYSLFLPLDHPKLPQGIIPSCNFISNLLIKALHDIGVADARLAEHAGVDSNRGVAVCFSRPTKYEVVVGDKKIIGSAQKRGQRTLMQHGSICVSRTTDIAALVKEPFEDTSIGLVDILNERFSVPSLIAALTAALQVL